MGPTAEISVLSKALDPLSDSLTRDEAQHIVDLKPDDAATAFLETLAAKANEGELTDQEARTYEAHVRAGNLMTLLQAKARKVVQNAG